MRGPAIPFGTGSMPLPAPLSTLPRLDTPGLPAHAAPDRLAVAASRRVGDFLESLPTSRPRIAVVVPDRTRPIPWRTLLPPLLAEIETRRPDAGPPTLVPASGIHRPMPREEVAALVGNARPSRVRIAPHDADRPGCLMGMTDCGLPVVLHPAVARADALVLVGRIAFHYLAGFGGGRKLLVPGVASRRTAMALHARCLARSPDSGRHPRARTGQLDGNPIHAAACAAVALAPPSVAMHVFASRNGCLSRIDTGDPVDAHATACADYAAAHRVLLPEPLDAVVVSAGGHPTDRDLVQAHKALDAVAPIVRPGGLIVLVARCEDGVGNPEVFRALEQGASRRILDHLAGEFTIGGHTAYALREKCERFDVRMLTELDDATLSAAGITRVAGLDQVARLVGGVAMAGGRAALAPHGAALLYELAGRDGESTR